MIGHDDKAGELEAATFPSGTEAVAQRVTLSATEQGKPTAKVGGDEENLPAVHKTA